MSLKLLTTIDTIYHLLTASLRQNIKRNATTTLGISKKGYSPAIFYQGVN